MIVLLISKICSNLKFLHFLIYFRPDTLGDVRILRSSILNVQETSSSPMEIMEPDNPPTYESVSSQSQEHQHHSSAEIWQDQSQERIDATEKKEKLDDYLKFCGKEISLEYVLNKDFDQCSRMAKHQVYRNMENVNKACLESTIVNKRDHQLFWKGFLDSKVMEKNVPMEQPQFVKELINFYNTTSRPQLQAQALTPLVSTYKFKGDKACRYLC